MNFNEFIKNFDVLISSLTGVYIVASVVVWRMGADLGNLKKAQAAAINGIAGELNGKELYDVIQQISEEEPRLLMPPKRNKFFLNVSLLTTLFGIVATFHEPLTKLCPSFEKIIIGEVVLFGCFLLFGFWVIKGEYKYLAVVKDWKPTGNGKKIKIVCS